MKPKKEQGKREEGTAKADPLETNSPVPLKHSSLLPDPITIPRNTLVVLCGPAGCGKSTFAAKHFKPTEIVSSDECRARLSDDPTNQGVSHHAFELMHFIIKKRLLLERLTVADAMHLESEYRIRLIRIARWFKFNTAVLAFDIPLEVCLARNAARARVVPEEVLRRQHEMFESARDTLDRDGFDHVFILDDEAQSSVILNIGPPLNRRPA